MSIVTYYHDISHYRYYRSALVAASIVDLCTYTNDASIRFASDVANHPGFVFAVIPAIKNVLLKGFVFCCYPSK